MHSTAAVFFRSHAWRLSAHGRRFAGGLTNSDLELLGDRTWPFGPASLRGATFREIVEQDPGFVTWAQLQRQSSSVVSEAVLNLCQYAVAREAAATSYESSAEVARRQSRRKRSLGAQSVVNELGSRQWPFGPPSRTGATFEQLVDHHPGFVWWAQQQLIERSHCSDEIHYLCKYAAAREQLDHYELEDAAALKMSEGAGAWQRESSDESQVRLRCEVMEELGRRMWPHGPECKRGLTFKNIVDGHPTFVAWAQAQRQNGDRVSEAIIELCRYIEWRSKELLLAERSEGGDGAGLEEIIGANPEKAFDLDAGDHWARIKNHDNVVFIGGVPFQAFDDDLKVAFEAFGPVRAAWIVYEHHGALRRSCRYGFVEFVNGSSATKCLEAGCHQVMKRRVSVRTWVDPAGGNESAQLHDPESMRTIFVGGIPREAREDDIRATFQGFGEVKGIRVLAQSNVQNDFFRFCFVEFGDDRSVEACLTAGDKFVLGSHVDVKRSFRKTAPTRKVSMRKVREAEARAGPGRPGLAGPDASHASVLLSQEHPFFTDLPHGQHCRLSEPSSAAGDDVRSLILRAADIIQRARPQAVYFAGAPHLKVGWDQRQGVDIAFFATPDLLLIDRDASAPGPCWDDWLAQLSKIPAKFALYETDRGHHAFLVSRRVDSRSMEALHLMHTLGCDEWYICFALSQGFRVRLSPKTSSDRILTDFVARPVLLEDLPEGARAWPELSTEAGTAVVGGDEARDGTDASRLDASLLAVVKAKQSLIETFCQTYRDLYLDGGLKQISKQMQSDKALHRLIGQKVCSTLGGYPDLGNVMNLVAGAQQVNEVPEIVKEGSLQMIVPACTASLSIDIGTDGWRFQYCSLDGENIQGGDEGLSELLDKLRGTDDCGVLACGLRGVDVLKWLLELGEHKLSCELTVHDIGLMKNAFSGLKASEEAVAVEGGWEPAEPKLALEEAMRCLKLPDNVGASHAYALNLKAQPVVALAERAGLPFDHEGFGTLAGAWRSELEWVEAELIELLSHWTGATVVIPGLQSSQEVENLIKQIMPQEGIDSWPRTPCGLLRTDASTLLRSDMPAANQVVRCRELHHALSHFASLETNAASHGGRLFPKYQLAGTVTGRMCCSGPNVQALPRDAEFRVLVTAPDGGALVKGDFSQIELRVLAEVSGDPNLKQAFASGHDFHKTTAATLIGCPEAEVTAEQRQLAKAINFGLVFGQSAAGLSHHARESYGVELSIEEAEAAQQRFFEAFPGVAFWQAAQRKRVDRGEAIVTPAGRVAQHLRKPQSQSAASVRSRDSRARVYREAINFPIQGGAAEVMLACLGHLTSHLACAHERCRPICVVHDEVLLECADEESAEAAAVALRAAMQAGWAQIFPEAAAMDAAGASIAVGPNWAELFDHPP